jgi:hypothetical protein
MGRGMAKAKPKKRKTQSKAKTKAKTNGRRKTKRRLQQRTVRRLAAAVAGPMLPVPDDADVAIPDCDLSLTELKFFALYIRLGGQHGDAVKAYSMLHPKAARRSANTSATRLLCKIKASTAFQQLLDAAGVGPTRLIALIRELVTATHVKPMVVDKELVEAGPYPDNQTRARAAELLAKMLGKDIQRIEHYTPEPLRIEVVNPPPRKVDA